MRIASNVGIHCLSINKYEKFIGSVSVYLKRKKKGKNLKISIIKKNQFIGKVDENENLWSCVMIDPLNWMCMKDWKG